MKKELEKPKCYGDYYFCKEARCFFENKCLEETKKVTRRKKMYSKPVLQTNVSLPDYRLFTDELFRKSLNDA